MSDNRCKGCTASVRLSGEQIEKILSDYLRDHPAELADDPTYDARLSACRACSGLQYGTTCRHCGCLVPVMARLAHKHCPRPGQAAW